MRKGHFWWVCPSGQRWECLLINLRNSSTDSLPAVNSELADGVGITMIEVCLMVRVRQTVLLASYAQLP